MSEANERANKAARKRVRIANALWWALVPLPVPAVVFALLCAKECTALPWVTLILAPVIALLLGLVAPVAHWLWASRQAGDFVKAERQFAAWSLVWGPVLALASISVAFGVVPHLLTDIADLF